MKKCRNLFMIVLAMFLMLPFDVDASIYVQGDNSYSVEKFDLFCNGQVQQSNGIIAVTSDHYFIPGVLGDIHLNKVNENECIAMSTKEVLDFYNNEWSKSNGFWTYTDETTGDIRLINNSYYYGTTYIDASGTAVVAGKYYYPFESGSDVIIDSGAGTTFPEGTTVPNGYHERVAWKFLDSSILESKTVSSQETYLIVDTWVSEVVSSSVVEADILTDEDNILKYRVVVDEDDTTKVIKNMNYDSTVFDDFLSQDLVLQSTIYNEYTDEVLFVYSDNFTGKQKIYNSNAELLGDYYYLYPLTPDLSVAMDNENYIVNTILDKDYKKLLVDDTFTYLTPFLYDNYINYGELMDNDGNRYAYKLYEYKVLSDKKVDYDGNDITYDLSAPADRISKIYINDKELKDTNYNVSGQSVARSGNGVSLLTFNEAYLSTLKKGTYSVKIEYVDGASNSVTFTILNDPVVTNGGEGTSQPENPNTYDGIGNSVLMGVISVIGLVGVFVYFKKKNRTKEN